MNLQTPYERRLVAIKFITGIANHSGRKLTALDAEDAAHLIDSLHTLGRTTRWHEAVGQWALAVRDATTDKDIRFAIVQYATNAARAA